MVTGLNDWPSCEVKTVHHIGKVLRVFNRDKGKSVAVAAESEIRLELSTSIQFSSLTCTDESQG